MLIESLECLEKKYIFKFPNDLRDYYLQNNGEIPKKREVSLQNGQWKSKTRINSFYNLNGSLEKRLETINEDWWIKGLIPFAYDDSGEEFCFSVRDSDYGYIYYFMTECLDEKNPDNALIKVSENFTQFMNSMG